MRTKPTPGRHGLPSPVWAALTSADPVSADGARLRCAARIANGSPFGPVPPAARRVEHAATEAIALTEPYTA